MKNLVEIKKQLVEYMGTIDIVDAHEHFTLEKYHLTNDYNFFHWFIPYVQFDLYSAGMPKSMLWNIPQTKEQVDEYWKVIKPLWPFVKHGSYASVCRRAWKEFYGIDDLNDDTYLEIGKKTNETRYEGYYKEILSDKCNIVKILNQVGMTSIPEYDYMEGAYGIMNDVIFPNIHTYVNENPDHTIDQYLEFIKKKVSDANDDGAVLVKYDATCFLTPPDYEGAKAEFENYKNDKNTREYLTILTYITEEILKYMKNFKMIAAVHTGVWDNVTRKSPKWLFPVVERHPDVVFDIYHMGMPYVREAGFLGKNYHNVYLNLCWSHIVSKEMAKNALDEWLDYVPVNKMFGFGADFAYNPENIYVHLEMAKDNIGQVLAKRVQRNDMTIDEAKNICKLLLHDNPMKVYNLK